MRFTLVLYIDKLKINEYNTEKKLISFISHFFPLKIKRIHINTNQWQACKISNYDTSFEKRQDFQNVFHLISLESLNNIVIKKDIHFYNLHFSITSKTIEMKQWE